MPDRVTPRPLALLLTCLVTLGLVPARGFADERFFTYTYEPKVLPEGALEFEQWTTLRAGKENGVYSRWDLRSELEVGLTDRLTTAFYLNWKSVHFDSKDDTLDESEVEFKGVSSEWKLKLLDPTADAVGVLLYGEVSTNLNEFELEQKLIVGKNIDRLVLAFNTNVEEEWEFVRENGESETESELKLEFTAGASFRVTDRFALGVEVREVNVFPDMEDLEHAALFAGPALHYSRDRWWATFTILPQIVALKGTTGDSVNLDEFERAEFRLIFGLHF